MTLTLFEESKEEQNATISGGDVDYVLITDPSQVNELIERLSKATTLAFDLEFTHLNAWYSHQLLWQLSDGETIYVGITDLVPLTCLAPILCSKTLIGHNVVTEFKQTFCATNGKVKLNRLIDTMQAYQVAKAGLLSIEWGGMRSSGLDAVTEQYHGFKMDKTTRKEFIYHPWATYADSLPEDWRQDPELFEEAKKTAIKLFTQKQLIYAANDVRFMHFIWDKLREELITKDVYLTAISEFRLIPVFGYLELVGWTVDDTSWGNYVDQLNSTLDNLVDKCKPALIEGLNNLEKNIVGDLVTKGNAAAHRRGGKIAKVRTDRSRVVMTDKNGNDRYSEDLQLRLFTPKHTDISFGRQGDKFKMSREQLQDAFTGLGVNLETMDKAAIVEALEDNVSETNKELLKSMQILTQVSKLVGTYGRNVLARLSPEKVLWFDMNQIGASATGRCIAKGTNIEVLRNVKDNPIGIPIEDVVVGDYVYSYDINKKLTLKKVIRTINNGTKRVIRLYWMGTGRHTTGYLDVTPDHLIRLVSGQYVRADSLKKNDRVMALSRDIDGRGYARLYPTGYSSEIREHKFAYTELVGIANGHVHHKDETKLNNKLSNLQEMTVLDHNLHHKNKASQETRDKWTSYLKQARLDGKCTVLSGSDHPNWLGLTKEWMLQVLWENQGKPTAFRDIHGIDYETTQKYLKLHSIDYKEISKWFTENGELITPEFVENGKKLFIELGQSQALKAMGLGFYRWKKAQELVESEYLNNHIIIKTAELPAETDVYDLEIEDTHNFIANQLCVHNCSGSAPNLQNIPSRGELGAKFRKFFIAPPSCKLIISDYSSLEQRIAAHCSQDPVMLQIYRENRDMHAVSAAAMFFLDYVEMETAGGYDRAKEEWADKKAGYDKHLKIWVKCIPEKDENGKDIKKYFNALTMEPLPSWKETSEFQSIKYMRDEVAKTCAFASNYGGNEVTLGRSLKGYSLPKLKEIYDSYVRTYKTMFGFMNKYGKAAVLKGETVNIAGRKRFYRTGVFEKTPPFLPYRPNKQQIDGMRRQGLNHPIQSLAADIVKLAMLMMYTELLDRDLLKIWGPGGQTFGADKGAVLICQVHDEIIVQTDDEVAEEVSALLKQSMENAEAFYLTTVPASASCNIGTNWSDK